MHSSRNHSRGGRGRGGNAARSLMAQSLAQTWSCVAERPVDAFAILGAAAATIAIVINAVFLQSGSHPAPFVANPAPDTTALQSPPRLIQPRPAEPKLVDMTTTHSVPTRPPQVAAVPLPVPPPARRNDAIAELIGPSPRIVAVQRVLAQYGYGQIKLSGTLDAPTSEAIEKFEREHKLPVSGRISDRLIGALAAMVGHPIE